MWSRHTERSGLEDSGHRGLGTAEIMGMGETLQKQPIMRRGSKRHRRRPESPGRALRNKERGGKGEAWCHRSDLADPECGACLPA